MNPAMAIGSAAVASPILIHLLSRRRFRRIRWAAMDFLLDAQRKNRRRVRIEQLILLMLRCLALFLLALAMMRPFLRTTALGAFGSIGRSERIVLLDDSFSMSYRSASSAAGNQSVFDRAAQAVATIARSVADESQYDSFTLLATSRPREPVLALANLSETHLRRLNDVLASQAVTQSAGHVPDAIVAVADMIRDAPSQANHVVYVVSDFQRTDWLRPSPGANGGTPSVLSPLQDLAKSDRSVRVILVDAALVDRPANVALTEVRRAQPQVVSGIPTRFELTVANYSPSSLEQVEVSLQAGEHTLPPVTIPILPAGQRAREMVEVAFPEPGSNYLDVRLIGAARLGDGVELDNQRILPVEVSATVKILVINGDPSGDPYKDEIYLLKTALHPEGRADSGNEIDVYDEQDLEGIDLAAYSVVVLANVDRLTTGAVRNLEAYVDGGGGLIIFAGNQLNIASYNEALYRDGQGLLPLPLDEITEASGTTARVAVADWDVSHPLMRAFVDELAAILRRVNVSAFVKVLRVPEPASRPTSAPNEMPEHDPIRVIVRLDDTDQSPLMIEKTFGRGRCIFLTTSADQDWNDWASSFSYLPMMLELVQYAAREAPPLPSAVVGAPLTLPVDLAVIRPEASLKTPAYPLEPKIALRAITERDHSEFSLSNTTRCGVYQFSLMTAKSEPITRYAAVNPDAAESDLARTSRAEVESMMGNLEHEYVDNAATFSAQAAAARVEIWWPLLMAAVVVFMAEHALARWFGARG